MASSLSSILDCLELLYWPSLDPWLGASLLHPFLLRSCRTLSFTLFIIRICLFLEGTGICSAAWLLALINKAIFNYQPDEVFIGEVEEEAHDLHHLIVDPSTTLWYLVLLLSPFPQPAQLQSPKASGDHDSISSSSFLHGRIRAFDQSRISTSRYPRALPVPQLTHSASASMPRINFVNKNSSWPEDLLQVIPPPFMKKRVSAINSLLCSVIRLSSYIHWWNTSWDDGGRWDDDLRWIRGSGRDDLRRELMEMKVTAVRAHFSLGGMMRGWLMIFERDLRRV